MPRGDKAGPAGKGPKTGRGAGYCAGYNTPGYMNPGFGYGTGMGWGRGLGRGRGWGRGMGFCGCPNCGFAQPYWSQPMDPKDEKQALSEYKKDLEAQIKEVDEALKSVSEKS